MRTMPSSSVAMWTTPMSSSSAAPNACTSVLLLLASGGMLWAASGSTWAVANIKPPAPMFGPPPAHPPPTERATIGLSGARVGTVSYPFHGGLCTTLPDCLALRNAGDRAHATLVASAAALLVACFVYEVVRAAALLPPAVRAFYVLRGDAVNRFRLFLVLLTLVVATSASLASTVHFARVGKAAASALEGKASNPLGALSGLMGGGAGGAAGAGLSPATIPWKDIPWAQLFPPSDGAPPKSAAVALRRRLEISPATPGAAKSDGDWISDAITAFKHELATNKELNDELAAATDHPDGTAGAAAKSDGSASSTDLLASVLKALNAASAAKGAAAAAADDVAGADAADAVGSSSAAAEDGAQASTAARAGKGSTAGARGVAAAADADQASSLHTAPTPTTSKAVRADAPGSRTGSGLTPPKVVPGKHAYVFGSAVLCALAAAILLCSELCRSAQDDAWPDASEAQTAFLSGALRV